MLVLHSAPNVEPNVLSSNAFGHAASTWCPNDSSSSPTACAAWVTSASTAPALRVVVEDADAQPTRVRAELVDVRPCGRRRDHGVADARAARRVEQRGACRERCG